MPPDVVYIVRDGPNEELRYSLRSLINLPHGRVWIVGGGPDWLTGVGRIKVEQYRSKHENGVRNIRAAIAHPDVANPFVLFNDDFFVVQPLDTVPVLHNGPLADRITNDALGPSYQRMLRDTQRLLQRHGHDDPLCYDLHVPMTLDKPALTEALDACNGAQILYQTVYGNLRQVGGTYSVNAKVHASTDDIQRPIPDGPFWSTNDKSFREDEIGRRIRAAFPEPSRYEIA